jgi:hypothetical protein
VVQLQDDEFLEAFHSCRLPKEEFSNLNHFRLAWLHVHRESLAEAEEHIRTGIRAYAAHLGAADKYHETITLAWVKLVATHREATFEEFLRENLGRLNPGTLHRFWSPELLAGERARLEWVAPDLKDLPLDLPC